MGNGNGTPADHWAAIEVTSAFQGGFIRESGDHGILRRVSDGRPAGRGGPGPCDNGVAAPGHVPGDGGEAWLEPTRYHAEDLASARHHDEPVARPGCVVPLAAAHQGSASCGPDTAPSYLVATGVHLCGWTPRTL